MNRIKIFAAILFFSLSGCEDYLDKTPEMGLTEDEVFLEYESARGFLDASYNKLLDIHAWDSQELRNNSINALSDELATVVSPEGEFSILTLNSGKWLNQRNMGEIGYIERDIERRSNILGSAFAGVRIANKVIANAEKIPNATQEEVNGLLGQSYFLRAWWYFQIIQRWGGMPVFDKVFSPTDEMDLPRLTYQESTEWLITDLDKAIELLPHQWADEQHGRPTKGSARGLKSMAALYASSPLMNNNLYSIQDNGYSIEWAERAAEYAYDAIEYVETGSGHNYRLMDGSEYTNIFYHEGIYASDESLWFKNDGNQRRPRDIQALYIPRRIRQAGGKGHSALNYSNPTQNIVDLFETDLGYPISHGGAAYDPANPYANRDPRLTYSIILPREAFGINAKGKPLFWEMYVGGKEFKELQDNAVSSSRMPTGYAVKKFLWPEANGFTKQWKKYVLNTIYIRVSQLYLDYAEAMNEAYGPLADPHGNGLTAVDAINKIRNRVGMPDVLAEFTASKEAFRDRIRNERSVELMFENHRWHDLRRWLIAEEVFKEPIKGMRATPIPGPPADDFDYEVVPLTVEQRVFSTRHYWYPVAQDHVESLYNFTQNPGW